MTMLDIYISYDYETHQWKLTLPDTLKNDDGTYRVTPELIKTLAETIEKLSKRLEERGYVAYSA